MFAKNFNFNQNSPGSWYQYPPALSRPMVNVWRRKTTRMSMKLKTLKYHIINNQTISTHLSQRITKHEYFGKEEAKL